MKYLLVVILCLLRYTAVAQYAPQVGLPGCTAIRATSPLIKEWATNCVLYRGYMDISNPGLGYTTSGDSNAATGQADHSIVSLGDSGVAVLTFANPISNGPGADFAVFENGFANPANDSQAFLELAFVEVSSDGVHFTRFPATSLTENSAQIAVAGDYMYCNQLNNLAGKYVADYGTPFDLNELAGTAGLDVSNVTHVRIVDVVGSIGGHAQHDHSGNIINDPYPTPLPSGGFDLDAVAVMNKTGSVAVQKESDHHEVAVYPNPVVDCINITVGDKTAKIAVELSTVTGTTVKRGEISSAALQIPVKTLPSGIYYLTLTDDNGNKWVEKIIKN